MAEGNPDVTLDTLHGDLAGLRTEMRSGFADLKTTMITGFAGFFTRDQGEEMLRVLREGNRRNDEGFTELDVRIREQHLETQQALHALVEGQRLLIEGQRMMSDDVKAIRARIDAFIRGRSDGEPTA